MTLSPTAGKILTEKDFHLTSEPPSAEHTLLRLQQEGYRLTQPRRAIVHALFSAGAWVRPEDLLALARRGCPGLGLVTVYRTLEVLERLGLARRVHGPTGCRGYAVASMQDGHFLICRRCHQVFEIECCHVDRLVRRVSRGAGFQVETHMLELVGLCAACARRETKTHRRKR